MNWLDPEQHKMHGRGLGRRGFLARGLSLLLGATAFSRTSDVIAHEVGHKYRDDVRRTPLTAAGGSYVNANDFTGGLAGAVEGGKNVGKTIIVNDSQTVNTLTIPSNMALKVVKGGMIKVNSGHTLTINAMFEAPIVKVFQADGKVLFQTPPKSIYPEWWGIDGIADDIQINQALQSLGGNGGTVQLLPKQYNIAAPVRLQPYASLVGGGFNYRTYIWGRVWAKVFLQSHSNCDMVETAENKWLNWNIELGQIEFDGNADNQLRGSGMVLQSASVSKFHDLTFYRCHDRGIYVPPEVGTDTNWFEDIQIIKCHEGIHDEGANSFWVRPQVAECTSTGIFTSGQNKYIDTPLVWRCGNGVLMQGNYNQVRGGYIELCGKSGVSVIGGAYFQIIGTQCISNDTSGIAYEAGIHLYKASHGIVTGNICTDRYAIGSKTQESGLSVDDETCGNLVITDNDFSGNRQYSVRGNLAALPASRACEKEQIIWFGVAPASKNSIVTGAPLEGHLPTTLTLLSQPDVPRSIGWEIRSTSITGFSFVISGFDAFGNNLSDSYTEADGWSGSTLRAYAVVISIQITSVKGRPMTGDTVDFGVQNRVGLSHVIAQRSDVLRVLRDNVDITAEADIDTTNNTVALLGITKPSRIQINFLRHLNLL